MRVLRKSRLALRYDSLTALVGQLGLPDAFHSFHAALERLYVALTEEFQPGLLCFRNALGGMVFAQALCMGEQMFFRYSSSVEGLSDVEGRLISLSL